MITNGGGLESAVDTADAPMFESANPEPPARSVAAGAAPWRKRSRLNRRTQFSLLIVRGDGVRVVRFNFVRPTAIWAGVALAASGRWQA